MGCPSIESRTEAFKSPESGLHSVDHFWFCLNRLEADPELYLIRLCLISCHPIFIPSRCSPLSFHQEAKKSSQKGRTAGGFTERMAILETELAEAMESNQQLRK